MNHRTSIEEFHSFGDWLRQRRKALDWSQAALSQQVGCTAATIRKIEAGERKPSQQLAALLATALGIPEMQRSTFLQVARQLRPISQLPSADLTTVSAAPLLVTTQARHNLPAPMTSLVNRLRDTANVVSLLDQGDVRLLTLLGPPGIGKTRLAIHTAEQIATYFRDGVWFVDLAPLSDATLVLPTIANVLSITETTAAPLLERLSASLSEKQLLLVLDNCEQVSAAAIDISALLRSCKGLKVLATSRTPLLLAGEYEYALPPLSMPPVACTPEQLPHYEAVQLFITRVRQHQRNFSISAANADAIITICLRLDGLPLALELAAAVLRRMSMSQLTALLNNEANWLHELQSPARDLPPRQQTLYHAIAWSYRLLDINQQTIFRQLGIFVDGFGAAAAQTVCGADQSTLTFLTEHNLLARAPTRWKMLEMIREFALTQMSSEEQALVQEKHIAYFAAQADLKLALSLEAIAQDHDNFRAALASAIAAQDAHSALTLCIKLVWFWEMHGHLRQWVNLVRAALALPTAVDTRLRFDILIRVSTLAWQVHQFDIALEFAEQTIALAHSHNDLLEKSRALNLLGRILIEQGEHSRAVIALTESAQIARQMPHFFNPGCPVAQLGEIALVLGDWETANRHLHEALALLAGEEGNLNTGIFIAMAHTDLAELALVHGDPAQARHELRQIVPYARLYLRRLQYFLVTLAGILLTPLGHITIENMQTAAALFGAIASLSERTGGTLSPFHKRLISERSTIAQQFLSQSEWQVAWQVGHAWTQEQTITEAERWLDG